MVRVVLKRCLLLRSASEAVCIPAVRAPPPRLTPYGPPGPPGDAASRPAAETHLPTKESLPPTQRVGSGVPEWNILAGLKNCSRETIHLEFRIHFVPLLPNRTSCREILFADLLLSYTTHNILCTTVAPCSFGLCVSTGSGFTKPFGPLGHSGSRAAIRPLRTPCLRLLRAR